MSWSQDAGAPDGAGEVFDSYVIACPAAPAAGTRLALRRAGPLDVSLHAGDGSRVGTLPPAEAAALRACLGERGLLRAMVRAVVPGRSRPRILVRIEAAP